ncbi:rhodanese-like domain-containing protein [Jannaschia pohangensis]|uniref:Rhodanese-related sulfurtransferase n=1 Tax=Jannaschia pohangensis TaxID=390807 RepID=A0A1I3S2N9_9RHOB|nr:rhodanese-like domain-containing protein [Jannaschia pohangensis]SFJ51811.1 Rhodanese-related sulfurtransferase [Jannaschia pohangensis]
MAHLSTSSKSLSAHLHLPDAPQILDLRDPADAAADPRRIPGARPTTLAELEASDIASGSFVCVCQKGGKFSQLAAAILRSTGASAQSMDGGHLAWIAADLPLVASGRLAEQWVLPTDPTWDELTSLWVLRRFIDRLAPVMPVTRDWLDQSADVWKARIVPNEPCDLASVAQLSHPLLDVLKGGSDRLIAGRLTRITTPLDALDLVDDWLAGEAA